MLLSFCDNLVGLLTLMFKNFNVQLSTLYRSVIDLR